MYVLCFETDNTWLSNFIPTNMTKNVNKNLESNLKWDDRLFDDDRRNIYFNVILHEPILTPIFNPCCTGQQSFLKQRSSTVCYGIRFLTHNKIRAIFESRFKNLQYVAATKFCVKSRLLRMLHDIDFLTQQTTKLARVTSPLDSRQ